MILGACNPPLAYEALEAEREIGLLLPCNVIVYEKDNKVVVSTVLPDAMMGSLDNAIVKTVGEKAQAKLKSVIDRV